MTEIEKKIQNQKKVISDLESEISKISRDIREAESNVSHSITMKHIGFTQMAISSIRPIGTYNFISNSAKESSYRLEISSLKSQKSSLENKLRTEKNKLKGYEEELEYESRPKAKLNVYEDKIYIDGDKDKTDITATIKGIIETYIDEHNKINSSTDVKSYLEKKEYLENLVKTLNLPKAEHSLLHQMECYKSNYCDFDYMVIDDKVLVDKDFISPKITEEKYRIEDYKKIIERYKKDFESFEPTFFGKLIKPLGRKQKKEFENVVLNAEKSYKNSINESNKRIENFNAIKSELIDPAVPAMRTLSDLHYLIENSYAVRQFIKKSAEREKNITEGTILKSKDIKDISFYLLKDIKSYLDKNKLKISSQEIINLIYENKQFSNLAKELYNIGINPTQKSAEKQDSKKQNDTTFEENGFSI
ncbi:MAG: hypothetical protein IJX17_01225 [Clostridia bacterium]|nr:hypothetical protein [Clostridia bacterium]